MDGGVSHSSVTPPVAQVSISAYMSAQTREGLMVLAHPECEGHQAFTLSC